MTFDLWFEMLYESSEAKGVSTIAVGKNDQNETVQ